MIDKPGSIVCHPSILVYNSHTLDHSLCMHPAGITDTVLSKFCDMTSDLKKYTVRPIRRVVFPVSSLSHIAINRLDRLTSGLLIIPLNADLARSLTSEFMNGSVRKEYVARCKGEFPVCVSFMDMDIFNMLMY